MQKLAKDTFCLGVAGFFIDKKYTIHAAARLRKWFLDRAQGMHPNLQNAQYVPGKNMGRPAGIIDSHIWLNIIIGLDFMAATIDDAEFFAGMRKWFGDYADWLGQSAHGTAAREIGNNISAWWAAQVMAFSIFSGNRDAQIRQCIDLFKQFINEKMDAAGCFGAELRRTRSLHYCLFHLNAMTIIAELAHGIGIDLYHWRGRDNKGLGNAFDFLMPYLAGDAQWPHPQITREQFPAQFSFHLAARRLPRPDFNSLNDKFARPADFHDVFGPEYIWPK